MRAAHRQLGFLAAMAWAVVGVLGGHLLTYALLFPDPHVHETVLAESGHSWAALITPATLTAATVAIALGLLGRGGATSRGVRFVLLAVLQMALFAGLELAERFTSGMTLSSLPHELRDHGLAAILVVGGLVQVLTAWLGSAVSRLVALVAGATRAAEPRRLGQPAALSPGQAIGHPCASVGAHGSRAPPAPRTRSLPILPTA